MSGNPGKPCEEGKHFRCSETEWSPNYSWGLPPWVGKYFTAALPNTKITLKAEATPEQEWEKEPSHPNKEGKQRVPVHELVNRWKAAGTRGRDCVKHLSELWDRRRLTASKGVMWFNEEGRTKASGFGGLYTCPGGGRLIQIIRHPERWKMEAWLCPSLKQVSYFNTTRLK